LPDVGHGQNNILGKGTVTVDPDSEGMGTEVAPSSETVAASAADYVAFSRDKLADRDIGDIGTDLYDLADEFVADDKALADGGAGPGIPIIDMKVSSTDSGIKDADFDVVDSNLRFGNIF
jgi:hypothetical protein